MNKAIGIGIGVVIAAVAVGIIGGSTFLSDSIGNSIPTEDTNSMSMGDKVSVSVTPAEEIIEDEESTEGKSLEVNLVDGVSATSTP